MCKALSRTDENIFSPRRPDARGSPVPQRPVTWNPRAYHWVRVGTFKKWGERNYKQDYTFPRTRGRPPVEIFSSAEELALVFSALDASPRGLTHPSATALDHPHRIASDNMGLREFLNIPKLHRRKRSKARSDIGPSEDTLGQGNLGVARPTESTPDLQTSATTSTTPGPPTVRGQESNGMQVVCLQTIHLTALFCTLQIVPPFLISPVPLPAKNQPRLSDPQLPRSNKVQAVKTNQTGSRLQLPPPNYSSLG